MTKIKSLFSQVIAYLRELLLFIYKPRKYFAILTSENTFGLLRRFIVYAVIFELSAFLLFIKIYNTSYISEWDILVISGFIEIIFCVVYIPFFLVIGRLCQPKVSIKAVISYCLSFHFSYGFMAMLSYGLFIVLEDYLFAAIRGIIVSFSFIFMFILFSLIFGYEIKTRIKALLLSLLFALILFITFSMLFSYLPNSSAYYNKYSYKYDPIGKEIDNLAKASKLFEMTNADSIIVKFLEVNNNSINFDPVSESKLYEENKDKCRKYLDDKILFYNNLTGNSVFNVSRKILNIKKGEIFIQGIILRRYDLLLKSEIEKKDQRVINKLSGDIIYYRGKTAYEKAKFISTFDKTNNLRLIMNKYGLIDL